MKRVMNSVKKAVKWYLKQSSETYAWTPSCVIPYVKTKNKAA